MKSGCGTAPLKSSMPSLEGNARGLPRLDCASCPTLWREADGRGSIHWTDLGRSPRIPRITDWDRQLLTSPLGLCESCMFITTVSQRQHSGRTGSSHGLGICLSRRNLLPWTQSFAVYQSRAVAHMKSGPLGSRQPCVDPVCDARPGVYIEHCGLRPATGRLIFGWLTGGITNRRHMPVLPKRESGCT